MIEPLALDWEKDGVKELADMLNCLAQGEFESADSFCDRLEATSIMIRSMWGCESEEHRRNLWNVKRAIEGVFDEEQS